MTQNMYPMATLDSSYKKVLRFLGNYELKESESPLEIAIKRQCRQFRANFVKGQLRDDATPFWGNISHAMIDPLTIKFPGYTFLASLAQNTFIKNGIQKIADEMTREWGKLSTSDDSITKEIESQMNRLRVQEQFRKAQIANGYYGGALIYIELLDNEGKAPSNEELMTPIYDQSNPEFVKLKLKGCRISRLKIIEPINFTAQGYNTTDPTDENYYKPTYYSVQGKNIHASRFLRISENYVPQIFSPIYNFLGMGAH